MSGLTRDGTTEPVSRDQILRRERVTGKEKKISSPRAGLGLGQPSSILFTVKVLTIHRVNFTVLCVLT